jgi:SAM-dependent methyltransferase
VTRDAVDPLVAWHDVECGAYRADLATWEALAAAEAAAGRPGVLDVGAGTGRVALALAAAGLEVTALDREPVLLDALAARAREAGLAVTTVAGDATALDLGRRFGMIVVPMQTIQLLPERAGFLAAARRHLVPGGLLAMAVAIELEAFDGRGGLLPTPDQGWFGGRRYASQAVRLVPGPEGTTIERIRTVYDEAGEPLSEALDTIALASVSVAGLEAEGVAAGFAVEEALSIGATDEHVGSEVVLLRA